jgi:NAD(P)-dependent dehydrogenase (short-subunit alcohol dehydrogenase family)
MAHSLTLLRRASIRVRSQEQICDPGQLKTKAEAEEGKKQFAAIIPLGRIGDTTELANAALFLASRDSSYVTGADLVVHGGWTQI